MVNFTTVGVTSAEAVVSTACMLNLNTRVGARTHLLGMTCLAPGESTGEGEVWEGVPAKLLGPRPPFESAPIPPVSSQVLVSVAFLLTSTVVSLLFYLPIFPSIILVEYLNKAWFGSANEDDDVGASLVSLQYFACAVHLY